MKKAFTLIEVLVIIAILMILIAMTFGGIKTIQTKAKTIHTRNTMATLHQALTIYEHHTGEFPIINSITEQYKLYRALTQTLEIKDFKGNLVAEINTPALNISSLIADGIIKQDTDEPTHYFFLDGWGTPILYMFGEITNTSGYSYNAQRVYEDGIDYNVNWSDSFDLVSFGKDTLSDTAQTQKNDITNF